MTNTGTVLVPAADAQTMGAPEGHAIHVAATVEAGTEPGAK
jgi:hypothetical protein